MATAAARALAKQNSFAVGFTDERPTFSVTQFRRNGGNGYLSGGSGSYLPQTQVARVRAAWSKPAHLRGPADIDALIDFCAHVPFLRSLAKSLPAEIAPRFHYRRAPRGSLVWEPGDGQARIFVLLAGTAEMVVEDALMTTAYPAISLGPGDLFGEDVADEKRRTTVTAVSDLELLTVDHDDLAELQQKQHSQQVEDAVAFLQRIALFADMSRKQLANLCSGVQTRTALRSTVIVRQDDEPDAVYVIKSGSCRVLRELLVPDAARALLQAPSRSPSSTRLRSRSPVRASQPVGERRLRAAHSTPSLHSHGDSGRDGRSSLPPIAPAAAKGRPSAMAAAAAQTAALLGEEEGRAGGAGARRSVRVPEGAGGGGPGSPGGGGGRRATFEVGELAAEDIFGEVGVLLGCRRKATVVADATCELLVISKQDFLYKLPPHVTERLRQYALTYPSDEAMLGSFLSLETWSRWKEQLVSDVVAEHVARRAVRNAAFGFLPGAAARN